LGEARRTPGLSALRGFSPAIEYADIAPMGTSTSNLRIAGLLLVLGAFVSFALHLLGAPEELYRSLYHHLLSGLDVPPDPSEGTTAAVRDVSLFGAIAELALGLALLAVDGTRRAVR
jgi:hypothetical protein